jgi:hypothetical protein
MERNLLEKIELFRKDYRDCVSIKKDIIMEMPYISSEKKEFIIDLENEALFPSLLRNFDILMDVSREIFIKRLNKLLNKKPIKSFKENLNDIYLLKTDEDVEKFRELFKKVKNKVMIFNTAFGLPINQWLKEKLKDIDLWSEELEEYYGKNLGKKELETVEEANRALDVLSMMELSLSKSEEWEETYIEAFKKTKDDINLFITFGGNTEIE